MHVFGARGQLAVRHELVTKPLSRNQSTLDLFVDAELGGGAAIYDDTALGRQVQPDGLIGIRAGYDCSIAIFTGPCSRPSSTFACSFCHKGSAGSSASGSAWDAQQL